jgi:hypothetical protein
MSGVLRKPRSSKHSHFIPWTHQRFTCSQPPRVTPSHSEAALLADTSTNALCKSWLARVPNSLGIDCNYNDPTGCTSRHLNSSFTATTPPRWMISACPAHDLNIIHIPSPVLTHPGEIASSRTLPNPHRHIAAPSELKVELKSEGNLVVCMHEIQLRGLGKRSTYSYLLINLAGCTTSHCKHLICCPAVDQSQNV